MALEEGREDGGTDVGERTPLIQSEDGDTNVDGQQQEVTEIKHL